MILKKMLLEPRIIIVALSVVGLITTLNGVYGVGVPGITAPQGGTLNPTPEAEYKILVPYKCESYNMVGTGEGNEKISIPSMTCFEVREYAAGVIGLHAQQWVQGIKYYDSTISSTPLFGSSPYYQADVYSATTGQYKVTFELFLNTNDKEFGIRGEAVYPQKIQGAPAIHALMSPEEGRLTLSLGNWKPIIYPPCTSYPNYPIAGVTAKTSESSFPPQNAKDRNIDTKWVSTPTLKPWIKADLGHQVSVCKVLVYWGDGSSHQYRFIVSVSSDGTSFTKVFSGKSAGTLERYSFPDTVARYVRIMVTESTPGDTNSIAQISEMFINKDPF
jgi:hypothetical protein